MGISYRGLASLTDFSWFSLVLNNNPGLLLRLCHDQILSNHFNSLFTSHDNLKLQGLSYCQHRKVNQNQNSILFSGFMYSGINILENHTASYTLKMEAACS